MNVMNLAEVALFLPRSEAEVMQYIEPGRLEVMALESGRSVEEEALHASETRNIEEHTCAGVPSKVSRTFRSVTVCGMKFMIRSTSHS